MENCNFSARNGWNLSNINALSPDEQQSCLSSSSRYIGLDMLGVVRLLTNSVMSVYRLMWLRLLRGSYIFKQGLTISPCTGLGKPEFWPLRVNFQPHPVLSIIIHLMPHSPVATYHGPILWIYSPGYETLPRSHKSCPIQREYLGAPLLSYLSAYLIKRDNWQRLCLLSWKLDP